MSEIANKKLFLVGIQFGLFTGKANPQELFFSGKLKIEGDMGLAMSLSAVTEGAKL